MAAAAYAGLLALAKLRRLVALELLLAARSVDAARDNKLHADEPVGGHVACLDRVGTVLRAVGQWPLGPSSFERGTGIARSGRSPSATRSYACTTHPRRIGIAVAPTGC